MGKVNYSRLAEANSSRIPDFQNSGFAEANTSRTPDFKNSRFPEFQISRIPDLRRLTLPEFQVSRIPEFQIFQAGIMPDLINLEFWKSGILELLDLANLEFWNYLPLDLRRLIILEFQICGGKYFQNSSSSRLPEFLIMQSGIIFQTIRNFGIIISCFLDQ